MTRKVDQGVVSALASLMKAQMLDCPFGQPKKKLPKDAARCGLVPRDERVLFVLAAWLTKEIIRKRRSASRIWLIAASPQSSRPAY